MTNAELQDRFWKLYGKRPAFSELEQFRRSFGSGHSYISEEDRDAIRRKRRPARGKWNNREARPARALDIELDEGADIYAE